MEERGFLNRETRRLEKRESMIERRENMELFFEKLVIFTAKAHNYILSLNDAYEKDFTDKQLHFIVIGILGMALILVIYPLFRILSESHILVIAFIYVFTVIIGLTFAIELGQKLSGTGTMEFGDVVFGIAGFLLMFAIFAVIRQIFLAIVNAVKEFRKK